MGCNLKTTASSGPKAFRAIVRAAACAVSAATLLAISCNFLGNVTKPFEYSSVAFHGIVLDRTFQMPIQGATVVLDGTGQRASTDEAGVFTIEGTRTGGHTVTVSKAAYHIDSKPIDVSLHPPADTVLLVRDSAPPSITGFSAKPTTITSIDDTVVFAFSACDSSGGIAKVILEPGMGSAIEKSWNGTLWALKDTQKFVYDSSGTFSARLMVIGKNADTSRDIIPVVVPDNDRPTFTSLRPTADGFINGSWGYIQIYSSDPDNNFSYLTIDWGDTSQTEKSFDSSSAPHWHMYHFAYDTPVNVTIRLVDAMGAASDTTFSIMVRSPSAPKLDNQIVFEPSQFLTPVDDSVSIGVKVLQIDSSYVPEIVWIVNENDLSAAQSVRKDYSAQDGAIGPVGKVFTCSFSTAKLMGTNDIRIIVSDRRQKTSEVDGSLYIAGKP